MAPYAQCEFIDTGFGTPCLVRRGRTNLRTGRAQRKLWIKAYGPTPQRWNNVCHACDIPACRNLNHFYLSDSCSQNLRDAFKTGIARRYKGVAWDNDPHYCLFMGIYLPVERVRRIKTLPDWIDEGSAERYRKIVCAIDAERQEAYKGEATHSNQL